MIFLFEKNTVETATNTMSPICINAGKIANSVFCFCTSCSGPRPKGRKSRRVVEVHRQHHLCLQTGRKPNPQGGSVFVGQSKGRGLQVPKDQVWQKVPAAGQWRGFPWTERSGGRQGQSGHSMEGHLGSKTPEVSAAGEERKMQESIVRAKGKRWLSEAGQRNNRRIVDEKITRKRKRGTKHRCFE